MGALAEGQQLLSTPAGVGQSQPDQLSSRVSVNRVRVFPWRSGFLFKARIVLIQKAASPLVPCLLADAVISAQLPERFGLLQHCLDERSFFHHRVGLLPRHFRHLPMSILPRSLTYVLTQTLTDVLKLYILDKRGSNRWPYLRRCRICRRIINK